MKVKERLDLLLVLQNLSSSRQQAQKLILSGEVKVNGQIIDKPGTLVDASLQIEVFKRPPYVSRGGEKLAKALVFFAVDVKDRICLDAGISSGGFTDCLLQAGAERVYGVDVGYGQVAWSLRQDPRVILKERSNIRYLSTNDIYGDNPLADFGVVDLSFISLKTILPVLWNLLQAPRDVILLIKPQFEVGRGKIGKKGVVRDPKDQSLAIEQVCQVASQIGWFYGGLTFSPLTGPAGNIEYLLLLTTKDENCYPTSDQIEQVTFQAQQALKGNSTNSIKL